MRVGCYRWHRPHTKGGTLMNFEKYVGLDVPEATIPVAAP